MKVLVLAGSVRSGSFNVQLAHAATKVLADMGAITTHISLADYPMPILDEDLNTNEGTPAGVVDLARQFAAHDALFIASPEYNSSITPLLKNAIDWVSIAKIDGEPLKGLTAALGSASPGGLGGIRGLYHLRSVLMNVGVQIITEQCAVSRAMSAFGEDGLPNDERTLGMLNSTCRALLEHAYPARTQS